MSGGTNLEYQYLEGWGRGIPSLWLAGLQSEVGAILGT